MKDKLNNRCNNMKSRNTKISAGKMYINKFKKFFKSLTFYLRGGIITTRMGKEKNLYMFNFLEVKS